MSEYLASTGSREGDGERIGKSRGMGVEGKEGGGGSQDAERGFPGSSSNSTEIFHIMMQPIETTIIIAIIILRTSPVVIKTRACGEHIFFVGAGQMM